MMEIYDSTLRDGGYINNWNFTPRKVKEVFDACTYSDIDYVEVGYLDKVDMSLIETDSRSPKLMVMMDYNKKDDYTIPNKSKTKIDGIRVASHKSDIFKCFEYVKELKKKGYYTGIQLMAVSNYTLEDLSQLPMKQSGLDMLTLADSNGSLRPHDVIDIVSTLRNRKYKLNFHAHNNLQLALYNTLTAMKNGADCIDCSFNGIGRGAGNLPTELILSYMNKYLGTSYNLEKILDVIDKIILPMKGAYQWGYNVHNMLSGIESVHPYYGRDIQKYELPEGLKKMEEIASKRPMKYYGNRSIVGVIPARLKSSRFPGKPLQKINDIELIKRVYNNCNKAKTLSHIMVATDSKKIFKFCNYYKIPTLLTSDDCLTGTDRVAEVAKRMDADLYVNIQGDEPLIRGKTIDKFVKDILSYGEIDREAFNAMTDCTGEDITNPNVPKVTTNVYGDLMYMSRYDIPYIKGTTPKYFKELGLHAYTKRGLEYYALHEQQNAERAENLEFLRFLETGKPVRMVHLKLDYPTHAIDVPEDIKIVEEILNANK